MNVNDHRKCPHFDTNDGVCGCPEFWRSSRRPQNDQSSPALRGGSSARYDERATNCQANTSVNPISLLGKTPQVTPAPPGAPKETCFFWYHGSCRREKCDRPHEAHPTWPVPPPPGFRHFSPCILPLCPLRSDLVVISEPKQYQQRQRTVYGRTDGASFNRGTTSGERPTTKDSNTETDKNEIDENIDVSLDKKQEPSLRHDSESSGWASKSGESTVRVCGVKAQEAGGNSFESDYVDLSQLPSPPSTPLVHEDALLSISHSGTLNKRCHSQTKTRRRTHFRLEEVGAAEVDTEVDNVTSVLHRSRKMSQWNNNLSTFGKNGQHADPDSSYLAALHRFPPQQSIQPTTTYNNHKEYMPPLFDPSNRPRSTGSVPLICFFYYHKGHCRPKNGRRCDYLHNMNTPQQTVSLPYGIDNHDPSCSLSLCPVRLLRVAQVKHEQDSFLIDPQPSVKTEPSISVRVNRSPSLTANEISRRDLITSDPGRSSSGMLGRPLLQLTGLARERLKEQKHRVEQTQAKVGMGLAEIPLIVDTIHQVQKEKQAKWKSRNAKKRELATSAEELRLLKEGRKIFQQEPNDQLGTSSMQRRLPPSNNSKKKKRRQRNKNRPGNQQAGGLGLEEPFEDEDICEVTHEAAPRSKALWSLSNRPSIPPMLDHPSVDETNGVSNGKAVDMVGSKSAWEYGMPLCEVMEYEYSQEALGLSSEERRAQICTEQLTRREAWDQRKRTEEEDMRAHLAASLNAERHLYQDTASNEDAVERRGCQWCRYTGNSCGSTKPSLRCEAAGIGAKGRIDWYPEHIPNEYQQDSLDRPELPDGDQRLDWDTDLIRRLFGEIE